jgi:hypothetical protein
VIQDPVTLLGYVDRVTLSKIAMVLWLEFGESWQFEGQIKIYLK